MKRFLFGVLIGIVLTVFFESKGTDILRAVGVKPEAVSQAIREIQGVLERLVE